MNLFAFGLAIDKDVVS